MTTQAKWKNKTFEVSNQKVNAISSFTLSSKLKTEEKKSKSGAKKVIIKGLMPEELQVNFSSGFAVGTDPRQEHEDFKKLAGQSGEFFFGSNKLGRGNFVLEEVSLGNTIMSNFGRIYHGEHTLKFSQYVSTSKKQKAKKKGYGVSDAEIAEAKSALGIGPSAQEKKTRK